MKKNLVEEFTEDTTVTRRYRNYQSESGSLDIFYNGKFLREGGHYTTMHYALTERKNMLDWWDIKPDVPLELRMYRIETIEKYDITCVPPAYLEEADKRGGAVGEWKRTMSKKKFWVWSSHKGDLSPEIEIIEGKDA